MYASTCLPDTSVGEIAAPGHQRVAAAAAVSFKHDGARTRLDRLYQRSSAKLRFPKQYGDPLETVLINTAGGLTGGDRLSWDLSLGPDCGVVVTTQACEKSYKSSAGEAQVQTSIKLAKNSSLHWLPQETILYEGSSLSRCLNVELERGAEFLGLECAVLGREAMGETLQHVALHDRWRISRSGEHSTLLFADDLRLDGTETSLASFGANRAVASLAYITDMADELLQILVNKLRGTCPAPISGFSGFGGRITGRILAPDSYQLRQALVPVLTCLRGAELPRVWRI